MGCCCAKQPFNEDKSDKTQTENERSYVNLDLEKNLDSGDGHQSIPTDGKSISPIRKNDDLGTDKSTPIKYDSSSKTIQSKHSTSTCSPVKYEAANSIHFNLGKYYDKENDIWYRAIYLPDTDLIRKQFLCYYNLRLNAMSEEEFCNWCDTHQYPQTKLLYPVIRYFHNFPYSRILIALTHKYEVKFYFSDVFSYKGHGPLRALVCYGRSSELVDRSLNEYEQRINKTVAMPNLIKSTDDYCFPDPKFELRPYIPKPPFSCPKIKRPIPEYEPVYLYDNERTFPLLTRVKSNQIDDTTSNQRNSNVNSEIVNSGPYSSTHFEAAPTRIQQSGFAGLINDTSDSDMF